MGGTTFLTCSRFKEGVMTVDVQLWMALLLVGFANPEGLSRKRESEGRRSLLVELCDTTELQASILQAARDEASSIFAKAAAHVQWESNCALPPPATPHSARIHVIPRVPEVIASEYYRTRGKRSIMGFAQPNPGENRAGVIYVARQAIEAFASKSGRISLTEAHTARAIGRVFAHELAHHFLGAGHTETGILKHFLDQRTLISKHNDGLFFSPDQVRVLRLRVEGQSPYD